MEGASSAEDCPPQKVPTLAAEQMSVGQSAAPGSLEVAVGGVAVSEQRELPTGPPVGTFRRGS